MSPHSVIDAAPCCTLTTAHTRLNTASTQLGVHEPKAVHVSHSAREARETLDVFN